LEGRTKDSSGDPYANKRATASQDQKEQLKFLKSESRRRKKSHRMRGKVRQGSSFHFSKGKRSCIDKKGVMLTREKQKYRGKKTKSSFILQGEEEGREKKGEEPKKSEKSFKERR